MAKNAANEFVQIGRPYIGEMHEELKSAIERIHGAAHAKGKKVGIYCTSGAQAREYADKGFDMVSPLDNDTPPSADIL